MVYGTESKCISSGYLDHIVIKELIHLIIQLDDFLFCIVYLHKASLIKLSCPDFILIICLIDLKLCMHSVQNYT